jgi:hypothetical protein
LIGALSTGENMTDLKTLEQNDKKLTREEHIINYLKTLNTIEQAIEPYREHKLALKKHYADNSFLSREDQSRLLKAYRMAEKGEELEDFEEFINIIKSKLKVGP